MGTVVYSLVGVIIKPSLGVVIDISLGFESNDKGDVVIVFRRCSFHQRAFDNILQCSLLKRERLYKVFSLKKILCTDFIDYQR